MSFSQAGEHLLPIDRLPNPRKLVAVGLASISLLAPSVAVGSAKPNTPPGITPGECFEGTDACYYYAGGHQFTKALGASVSLSQPDPEVSPEEDNHSLAELTVASNDRQQAVEIGWEKSPNITNASGIDEPYLFVNYWVNGKSECTNSDTGSCDFIPLSNSALENYGELQPASGGVDVGQTGKYAVQFSEKYKGWLVAYNGVALGYIPEASWDGNFTEADYMAAFGEVASPSATTPQSQMGNGEPGTSPNSASISNFKLIGSSIASPNCPVVGSLYPYQTDPSLYTYGLFTGTGLHYGGPGASSSDTTSVASPTESLKMRYSKLSAQHDQHRIAYEFSNCGEYNPTPELQSLAAAINARFGTTAINQRSEGATLIDGNNLSTDSVTIPIKDDGKVVLATSSGSNLANGQPDPQFVQNISLSVQSSYQPPVSLKINQANNGQWSATETLSSGQGQSTSESKLDAKQQNAHFKKILAIAKKLINTQPRQGASNT